jgi:hypothetical protein
MESHVRLGLSGLFSSGFPTKTLHAFVFSRVFFGGLHKA